jgi:hypothetical protein
MAALFFIYLFHLVVAQSPCDYASHIFKCGTEFLKHFFTLYPLLTVSYFEYFYAKMITLKYLFMDSNAEFLLSRALCNLLPLRILVNR